MTEKSIPTMNDWLKDYENRRWCDFEEDIEDDYENEEDTEWD